MIPYEIAYWMRRLYRQKLTTTSGGNISARVGNRVFITPSGIDKARLRESDIAEIDLSGQIIHSKHPLSMETPMHLAIYLARPDILAIVHAHPPFATALACATNPSLDTALTSEGRLVLGEIGWAAYELMGTKLLAQKVADTAVRHQVILMQNHGAIALGRSLLQAFDRLEVLEYTCQIQHITNSMPPVNRLSESQVKEIDQLGK